MDLRRFIIFSFILFDLKVIEEFFDLKITLKMLGTPFGYLHIRPYVCVCVWQSSKETFI